MTEQQAQDQPGCSAALRQATLHVDLPHADQGDVLLTISQFLMQVPRQHWDSLRDQHLTFAMLSGLAFSCMDIIQTFAEDILDSVLPQVYRYQRENYGSLPTDIRITEDQIHTYLEGSVGWALTKCLKTNVQNLVSTKLFSELLVRHISRSVNSVLALTTQAPIVESRVPVFFVSIQVTSIRDLKDMAFQMAIVLMTAITAKPQPEPQLSLTELPELIMEAEPPVLCEQSNQELVKLLGSCMIHRVVTLKGRGQRTLNEICSSTQRVVCIRVGINTHVLSVEDDESCEHEPSMSDCSGQDAIPGTTPDSDEPSPTCFDSAPVLIVMDRLHNLTDLDMIKKIAEELVVAFLEDQQGAAHTNGCEENALKELEDIDKVMLKEFTDRVFRVVMNGLNLQSPIVPDGASTSNTVTHGQLRRGIDTDPHFVALTLYMRTEELVARCVLQVLLWSALQSQMSAHASPCSAPDRLLLNFDYYRVRNAMGDHFQVPSRILSLETYDILTDSNEALQDEEPYIVLRRAVKIWLRLCMLTVSGVRRIKIHHNSVIKLCKGIQTSYFEGILFDKISDDITQALYEDLQPTRSSAEMIYWAALAAHPSFEEAVVRVLRALPGMPTSLPSPLCRNAARRVTCFFKKCKQLCRNNTRSISVVIVLSSDLDDSDMDEFVRRGQCRRPGICSSFRKMFSSVCQAMGRLFNSCCRVSKTPVSIRLMTASGYTDVTY